MKYLIFLFILACSTPQNTRSISGLEKVEKIEVEKNDTYLVDELKVCGKAPRERYNRSKFWGTIATKKKSCLDVTRLVLNRDKMKHRAFEMGDSSLCEVKKGSWIDYFSGEDLSIGKSDDEVKPVVTFTIPLRTVFYSGGYRWSKEKRAHYFNHIIDQEHHVVTSKSSNLKRQSGDPAKYIGDDFGNLCAYAGAWMRIKKKWGMCVFPTEAESLKKIELACKESYSRDDWRHWIDEDRDCLSSRQEALIRDSETGLSIEKKDGKCHLKGGSWLDPYSGETYTDPKEMDIDHFVPLKNAHLHGAWSWPSWKKKEFANFMNDQVHLISVSYKENRSKSAKGPEAYLPKNEKYICSYMRNWLRIKSDWSLYLNQDEYDFLDQKNKEHKCRLDLKVK